MGAVDAVDIKNIIVDESPRILAIRNVQFQQQIPVTTGRMQLGIGFTQSNLIGNVIGLARLATDLNKDCFHRARLFVI